MTFKPGENKKKQSSGFGLELKVVCLHDLKLIRTGLFRLTYLSKLFALLVRNFVRVIHKQSNINLSN